MIYLTPITFNGKQPNTPRVVVANRDDNNSQALPIRLPVLDAAQTVTLHWVDSDANGQEIPLEARSVPGEYLWLVSETDTRKKADLSVWIEINAGDDTLWVSDTFIASVGQRLSHNNIIAQRYPDKLQELIDDVRELQENDSSGTVTSVNGVYPDENGNVEIETVSQEEIGEAVEKYLDENPVEVTETDPTVPAWAKAAEKPSYTAAEVNALGGASVYNWLHSSNTGVNDLFEIILNHPCGIIKNGRGGAPSGMMFPAFVVVGSFSYGNANFTVYDFYGQTWQGIASLTKMTVTSINRVYPSAEDIGAIPSPTTATPDQLLAVNEVDADGKPTSWKTVDAPDGGGGIEVTGATVGQTVKIAAVDSSGVPTAWEPVDLPKGEEWEHICDISVNEADGLSTVEQSLGADYRKILIAINNNKAGGIVNKGSDSWSLRIRANSNPNDNTLVAVCNTRASDEGWNTFRFVIEYLSAGNFTFGVTYTYGTTNTVFEKTNFDIKNPIHTVYLVANGGMRTFTAQIFGVKA